MPPVHYLSILSSPVTRSMLLEDSLVRRHLRTHQVTKHAFIPSAQALLPAYCTWNLLLLACFLVPFGTVDLTR